MEKLKSRVNVACLALAPCFGAAAAVFLYLDRPLYALFALVGIVACMEARVRIGYRGPRRALFAIHLACSSALIVALLSLLMLPPALWQRPLAWFSFIGMGVTGALLLRQSWHRRVPELAPYGSAS